MDNAKKQKKTIEWERLEISSRKIEIPSKELLQSKDKNTDHLILKRDNRSE